MNVLFIGNSYTYFNDMPTLFAQLANCNGKNITVSSVTRGGRKLIDYTDSTDPTTQKLDALLEEAQFDVCFLQEQSVLPITDYDRFLQGLECVLHKLQSHPCQKILYATWSRKDGHSLLTEKNWSCSDMTDSLSKAYGDAARLHDARVSPAGLVFRQVALAHPEIELYDPDGSHPSYAGSCLAALTHYFTLFGTLPKRTDSLALSSDTLSAFQSAIQTLPEKDAPASGT